jgi:hypothetical protein
MFGVDAGAVDIEMTLPDLGDSAVWTAGPPPSPNLSAEKPNFQHAVSAGGALSVSYHPRQQVRPQGRLHVHPHRANGTGVTLELFRRRRSPL